MSRHGWLCTRWLFSIDAGVPKTFLQLLTKLMNAWWEQLKHFQIFTRNAFGVLRSLPFFNLMGSDNSHNIVFYCGPRILLRFQTWCLEETRIQYHAIWIKRPTRVFLVILSVFFAGFLSLSLLNRPAVENSPLQHGFSKKSLDFTPTFD